MIFTLTDIQGSNEDDIVINNLLNVRSSTYIDAISMGLPIVHFKGSQKELTKL